MVYFIPSEMKFSLITIYGSNVHSKPLSFEGIHGFNDSRSFMYTYKITSKGAFFVTYHSTTCMLIHVNSSGTVVLLFKRPTPQYHSTIVPQYHSPTVPQYHPRYRYRERLFILMFPMNHLKRPRI